jgi:hypothetical protein
MGDLAGGIMDMLGSAMQIFKVLLIAAGAIAAVIAIIAAWFWFDGERCSRGGP